ncbi:MAG: DUF4810 domain-containing protein [Planctomycetota bacterium]
MKPAWFIAGAVLLPTSACESSPDLYKWGHYEESTYRICTGELLVLADEIRALSGEIEKQRIEGRRPSPGMHAHLGYLYALSGNPDSARLEFEAEKALYPESAKFIDGVLRRMET